MPATEKTARDTKLLHKLFGISGVLLLLATFWLLRDDHTREWKGYQRTWIDLENRQTAWTAASLRDEADAKIAALQQELLAQRLVLPDKGVIDKKFLPHVDSESDRTEIDKAYAELKAAIKHFAEVKSKGEKEDTAEAADEVFDQRDDLVEVMRDIIGDAKFEEERLLQERKFASADLDAKRSRVGIAVRDSKPPEEMQELEEIVAQQEKKVSNINLEYQDAAAKRNSLQDALNSILAEEAAVQKKIDDKRLELTQLESAIAERSSTYFVGEFPFVGKRMLELPILDAFNSPRKIDNLWTDNLTIDYNFRRVRRFDRCTTCHQGIDKSGGYVPEHDLQVVLATPEVDPAAPPPPAEEPEAEEPESTEQAESEDAETELADQPQPTVESVYGMLLGDISLTGDQQVTVHAVTSNTLAASAAVNDKFSDPNLLSSQQIREGFANPYDDAPRDSIAPGLQMGDRIIAINGNEILSLEQAQRLLLESVTWGTPLDLTIRRGVPHPFTSHPRLDLFLGSLSPHPISKFGCTSCHEGQGNATEFKWVSHTPNTLTERTEWMKEYGWFNNHHWIYPMNPARFAESGCLKCHHDVTELAASERFPEPPAPKVTQGHHLILEYGCFGCHEINGYSGSERIGPDMRLEPNFYAAALALQGDPQFDAVPEQVKDWTEQIAQHPERDSVRRQLVDWLERDFKKAEEDDQDDREPVLTADAKRLTDVLKDVETPGQLRKVGPSLRHAASKLDKAFVYDWLENPRDFRPSTRMPRFFGLNAHLAGSESLHTAETFQPIEILAISTYLLDRSQQYEFAEKPEGIESGEEAEQIARGKQLFEIRGCLACHNHDEFPRVAEFREQGEIPPGPDLSGIGSKFSAERNEHGAQWLYSWIKNPSSYNPRTIMPDLKLEPIKHSSAQPTGGQPLEGEQPADASETAENTEAEVTTTDPIADIVAYLMSNKKENWNAQQGLQLEQNENGEEVLAEGHEALKELSLEYLQGAFYVEDARLYYERGITYADTDIESLKGAEVEMVVEADGKISDRQRLLYVGRKAIGKYGCYACHDIPGFEDAKPIGAALADWGRKEPSKLAFEHISEYLSHGHGGGDHGTNHAKPEEAGEHQATGGEHADAEHDTAVGDHVTEHEFDYEHGGENFDPYYHHVLEGHQREGFIYQKLREPRSYDYHKAGDKGYNEWLRMPAFPFDHTEREQIITFVLGLVADPPAPEFVYQPGPREKAMLEGQQVLTKYNCTGCHMLEVEQWDIAYPPDAFRPPPEGKVYPFMNKEFTAEQLKATLAESASDAGFLQAHLKGLPAISNDDALPVVQVEDGGLFTIEEGEEHDPDDLYYQFQLWDAAAVDGSSYQVGNVLTLPASMITDRQAPHGGLLTRYLLPKVTALEKQVNPGANGSEAYAWLPPPLANQGNKTQGDWLFNFLLDPHQIRPAVFLQMPKFNMSPEESRKLVNYFAARDNANFPYEYSESQQSDYLARMESQYQAQSAVAEEAAESETTRLDAAMQIMVNKNYCMTCHIIGDYQPGGSDRAKAPNLAEVYKRLRYDYVFPWIANPPRILPYTAMPINIPYDPDLEHMGGIPQKFYHGTSTEQVRVLTDLLMNYDKYTKQKTQIGPLIKASEAAAEETGENNAEPTDSPASTADPPTEPAATTASESADDSPDNN